MREQRLLSSVLTELRKELPFALLGLDTDNDTVPSVTTMLRQSPAGSLPLRAEVETSDGYAPYH